MSSILVPWRQYGGPGKFEGEPAISELAYDASLDGADDEAGSVTEGNGWYGPLRGPLRAQAGVNRAEREDLARMTGAILYESPSGFIEVTWYGPGERKKLEADWDEVLSEVEESEDFEESEE